MSTNPASSCTNQGDIVITLDAAKAQDGGQFPDLHQGSFYNGTVFHRVIDGFMVQGGGFEPGMKRSRPTPRSRTRPTTA